MKVHCNICHRWLGDDENIVDHIRDEHGIDEPIATWPDGEPVIIDETLEPEDFS